jgi:hypothetical protein
VTSIMNDPANPSPTSPLHAAMLMADVVRSSLQKTSTTTTTTTKEEAAAADFRLTPGLLEGLAVGVATLLVLTPVRSALLRTPAATQLGMLPDLVLTSTQIMVAAQAALYGGGLYGSYHYLQTFGQIPVDARSPTADAICERSLGSLRRDEKDDDLLGSLAEQQQQQATAYSSWNPQTIVLAEYAKALQLCRDRAARRRAEDSVVDEAAAGRGEGTGWW